MRAEIDILPFVYLTLVVVTSMALALERRFIAFVQLLWSPRASIRFIKDWTNSKTAALATLIFSSQAAIALGMCSASLGEPYRSLEAYIWEAIRFVAILGVLTLPFAILFTGLIYLVLSYSIPLRRRDLMRRFLLLSTVVFTVPLSLWSFFVAVDAIKSPTFQLVMGKPSWVASPLVGVLASYPAITVVSVLYLVHVGSGLWRIREMPEATEEPTCGRCSYNLTGNVTGICPECGTKA